MVRVLYKFERNHEVDISDGKVYLKLLKEILFLEIL